MTEQNTTLDEILNDDQTGQEPEDQGEAEQNTATEPEVNTDHAGEKQTDAPPTSEDENKSFVPLKAFTDERGKRQQVEKDLEALRLDFEQLKTSTQPSQNDQEQGQHQSPDPYLDPEEYAAHQQQQMSQLLFNQSCEQSEAVARKLYPDYQEKEDAFTQAVANDPTLSLQLRQSPAPAFFAYEKGKELLELQEFRKTDPNALRAEVKAELMKELEAAGQLKTTALAPSSLADEASSLSRTENKWDGPTPMSDILKS